MSDFSFLPDDIELVVDIIVPNILGVNEVKTVKMNKVEFVEYVSANKITIAGNGVMYHNKTVGFVPTILSNWFEERNSFKRQMNEYPADTDEYRFYDRKQLITKILLNSLYGVLLLPSFRFYDKQNGEAVTMSSQDIIKFSNYCINKYYQNNIPNFDGDAVQYSDTDSNYINSIPLWSNPDETDEIKIYKNVQAISKKVCGYVNDALVRLSALHFNSNNCKLLFQEEKVSKRAFWGQAKKRYAQLSVNIKDGQLVEKLDIKGFDVVRSSFPKAFRKILKELIIDILHDVSIEDLNAKIRKFKKEYANSALIDIMLSTGVKEMSKYEIGQKATPIYYKAAQNYNSMLKLHKIETLPPIDDGDKIIYAYMKSNPFGFETMALRGYDDPKEIVEFVERFIDKEKVFENAFLSKVNTIWEDLNFGKVQLQEESNFF